MIKTHFIYFIQQAINIFCLSSGISCLTYIFKNKLPDGFDFIIGGIGILSIAYSVNKFIELYQKNY